MIYWHVSRKSTCIYSQLKSCSSSEAAAMIEGVLRHESWNSANDFIFLGKGGEMALNRADDQEIGMLSLHLLQLSLVYINTTMIQQVLAEPTWAGRLNADDRRGLTPLVYAHVNPYGSFQLDLHSRLPTDPPASARSPPALSSCSTSAPRLDEGLLCGW